MTSTRTSLSTGAPGVFADVIFVIRYRQNPILMLKKIAINANRNILTKVLITLLDLSTVIIIAMYIISMNSPPGGISAYELSMVSFIDYIVTVTKRL